MSYGETKYGESPYKYNSEELEKTVISFMQRFPTGRAFDGKYILALEKAFAGEFSSLKSVIKGIASEMGLFYGLNGDNVARWESLFGIVFSDRDERISKIKERYADNYSQKVFDNIGSLSRTYIESQIKKAKFENVKIFYSTGSENITLPLPSTHTYFGNPDSMFGKNRQEGTKEKKHKAQFGENIFEEINPKNFKYGRQPDGSMIDYILDEEECSFDDAHKLFELINSSNRFVWRFVFYVGRKDKFLQPIIFEDKDEYMRFRRLLLELKQLGMFGIIKYKIKKKKV